MRFFGSLRSPLGAGLVLMVSLSSGPASAAPATANKTVEAGRRDSARAYYDQATSAFGLGKYDEAAELYEKAFQLHADAALLYNAAQAHRQAGHRDRALILYKNFLRLYPDAGQAADARRHADELEKASGPGPVGDVPTNLPPKSPTEGLAVPSSPPPVSPLPSGGASSPNGGTVPAANLTAPATTTASTSPGVDLSASHEASSGSHAWVWWTIGGAVLVAGVVTTVVLLSGKTHDPSPSLGTIGGLQQP